MIISFAPGFEGIAQDLVTRYGTNARVIAPLPKDPKSGQILSGMEAGIGIDFKEVSKTATDVYKDFIETIDRYITKLIMGAPLTTSEAQYGTYNVGLVHKMMSDIITAARARAIERTINRLFAVLRHLNFPQRPQPRFVFETRIDDKVGVEYLDVLGRLADRNIATPQKLWLNAADANPEPGDIMVTKQGSSFEFSPAITSENAPPEANPPETTEATTPETAPAGELPALAGKSKEDLLDAHYSILLKSVKEYVAGFWSTESEKLLRKNKISAFINELNHQDITEKVSQVLMFGWVNGFKSNVNPRQLNASLMANIGVIKDVSIATIDNLLRQFMSAEKRSEFENTLESKSLDIGADILVSIKERLSSGTEQIHEDLEFALFSAAMHGFALGQLMWAERNPDIYGMKWIGRDYKTGHAEANGIVISKENITRIPASSIGCICGWIPVEMEEAKKLDLVAGRSGKRVILKSQSKLFESNFEAEY